MDNSNSKPILNSDTVVPYLLEIFERRGPEAYLGESVSMADHMEQSAACAVADNASNAIVIASLLHDSGHFSGEFALDALEHGIANLHQDSGGEILAQFYPAEISEPVRLHVAAKRYLCAVDSSYFSKLSPASVNSLELQGGFMNAAEIKQFEANPHHLGAVQLRRYDDDGKVAGLAIYKVDHYRDLLQEMLL